MISFSRLVQSALLCLFLSGSMNIASANITTKSKAAILMDAQSKRILFEKNAELSIPPASMSKMMTVYVIFDAIKRGDIKLSDKFNISKKAWKQIGSRMFLNLNDKVSVENLLKGAIVQSGNDACIALAEGLSGSVDSFVMRMNSAAQKLGLSASNFANPTGLPNEQHYMSVKDLATLARSLVYEFPEYYEIYQQKEFTWNNIKQPNRNPLLYHFSGADGIKTGYTDKAGYCLVGSAKRDKMRLISVVSGLKSNRERKEESIKLLGYGFSEFQVSTLSAGKNLYQVPVYLGKSKFLDTSVSSDIDYLVKKSKSDKVSVKVDYQVPVMAPVSKGDVVGTLTMMLPDKETKITRDIIAKQDIAKADLWARFVTSFKYFLFGAPEFLVNEKL